MPDQTTVLSLPLIMPAQAQKHVTHNEALRILDVAVQLAVLDRNRSAPPELPAIGDRHIVGDGATGEWAGQEGRIALFGGTGWEFFQPLPGWRAQVLSSGEEALFDGVAWGNPGEGAISPARVGINTASDATNRLAVAAEATLLTHAGAGHQLKINKSSVGDTASLLYQTGWSGRAEMGLAGNDDFAVKVSADGSAWLTGVVIAADTGHATFPQRLRLSDGSASAPSLCFDSSTGAGLFRAASGQIGFSAGGSERMRLTSAGLDAVNLTRGGAQVFSRDNILGTVGQSGGVPDGAIIERGSNANGEYVRFADGTQICTQPTLIDTTTAANTTGSVSWTFPAGFVSPGATCSIGITTSGTVVQRENAARHLRGSIASGNTASTPVAWANLDPTNARTVRVGVMAVGRWF